MVGLIIWYKKEKLLNLALGGQMKDVTRRGKGSIYSLFTCFPFCVRMHQGLFWNVGGGTGCG